MYFLNKCIERNTPIVIIVYHFLNALLKFMCGVMNVSENGGIGSSKVMILHGQLNSQAVTLRINF